MPTLDKWIVKQDTDGEQVEPLFTVFFLDGETMKAQWLREMPKDAPASTYSVPIKWPALDDTVITLTTNIGRSDADKFEHFILPSEMIYNNVPYLKSHLQKCIRRSNLNLALKTTLHLAKLDLQELLRRLAIIMVEDAILLPEFSTLVWLTAALSKGFCLDKKRIYWLFGLVAKLALINIRDPIHLTESEEDEAETKSSDNKESKSSKTTKSVKPVKETKSLKQGTLNFMTIKPASTATGTSVAAVKEPEKKLEREPEKKLEREPQKVEKKAEKKPKTAEITTANSHEKVDKDWKKWKIYKLKDGDKSMIQSLLFRESYGGMKGDKNMLIEVAGIWLTRFSKNVYDEIMQLYRSEELRGPFYVSPPEENLKVTEWIIAAIDFHVVNNIVMILADKYETLSYEDIKSAIWHHSSKYTNKVSKHYVPSKDVGKIKSKKAWDIIRPEFYSLAAYFLKNNH